MLAAAVGLLRGQPAVLEAVRRRHTHVLCDEFQDSNMLQARPFFTRPLPLQGPRMWGGGAGGARLGASEGAAVPACQLGGRQPQIHA